MLKRNELHQKAFDEAVQWVVRLDSDDVTEAEKEQFLEWTERAPLHRAMLEEAQGLWSGFAALDPSARRELRAYAHLPCSPWHPALLFPRLKAASLTSSGIACWASAATLLLTMVAGVVWWQYQRAPRAESYATAAGEQKTVTLGDGTRIHLNTRSRIVVHLDESIRQVELREGEALFEVAHRPTWPFHVDTGNGSVRVLGTRFNVLKEPSHEVTVTVVSGEVEVMDELAPEEAGTVWRRNLIGGQQVAYGDAGIVAEVARVDVGISTSWRRGMIVLEDVPLVDAIAEFNRYSARRIVLMDPALKNLRIGGVFSVTDIPSALRSLEVAGPIAVVSRENFIGLTARREP